MFIYIYLSFDIDYDISSQGLTNGMPDYSLATLMPALVMTTSLT